MGKRNKRVAQAPPSVPDEVLDADLTYALIVDDVCPWCLGRIDGDWICEKCGRDFWNYLEDVE